MPTCKIHDDDLELAGLTGQRHLQLRKSYQDTPGDSMMIGSTGFPEAAFSAFKMGWGKSNHTERSEANFGSRDVQGKDPKFLV